MRAKFGNVFSEELDEGEVKIAFEQVPSDNNPADFSQTLCGRLFKNLSTDFRVYCHGYQYNDLCLRRVAQAFDLGGIAGAGGTPSFAHFAKGGSWNVHTMGRTHVASTASRPALAKNARTGYPQSCNRRGNQNRRPGRRFHGQSMWPRISR